MVMFRLEVAPRHERPHEYYLLAVVTVVSVVVSVVVFVFIVIVNYVVELFSECSLKDWPSCRSCASFVAFVCDGVLARQGGENNPTSRDTSDGRDILQRHSRWLLARAGGQAGK